MATCWREPQSLAAGDTLIFERHLKDYDASLGWSLKYEMRGGVDAIEFTSVPDGNDHSIVVASATTALWQPASYILAGYALLASTGERHQIYYGDFSVTANMPTLPGNSVVTTHYQRMVTLLQTVMEGKATNDLLNTVVEGTRVDRMSHVQLAELYAKYYQLRQNEIDGQRAKNGQPSRNKVRPFFNITPPGNVFGFPAPISSDFFRE